MSVQFDGEVIDDVRALTEYWPGVQRDFPVVEKQPPLPAAHERFEISPPRVGLSVEEGVPSSRYWFVSEDQSFLVQVQPDRFALNWRRVEAAQEYPRYRQIRPRFEQVFSRFVDLIRQSGSEPQVGTCEITYINHVPAPGSSGEIHGPLSGVLRALNPTPTSPTFPPVEDTQMQQRFRITGTDGQPVARLYLTATPAFLAADSAPIYAITLMVRGRPSEPTMDGALEFFDHGRTLIVTGFKESTTEEMHRIWGLEGL